MTHPAAPAPGRRSAARRGRLNVTMVLAVLLPVLCAVALSVVRPGAAVEGEHPPARTALTRATLACPSALAGAPGVAITTAGQGGGSVTVGLGKDAASADVVRGQVTSVTADPGPVAVTGQDASAPGLVAGRFGDREEAAVSCPMPAAHAWFTGVGAGAGHTSVLQLVNPDAGTALADITVYGRSGPIDVPRLLGVSVSGHSSVQLDLASLVPRRDELALEVTSSRGRIGATVLDRVDPVGARTLTEDWLPAQAEPATHNLLMGLAPGSGRRTLVIANGGDSEVRADVRIVTDRSVFAPEGVDEVRVAPQSVERVPVAGVLDPAIKAGALGLEVRASGPVSATLRSYAGGDLSHAVPGPILDGASTVLLPPGDDGVRKTLLLAGAAHAGAVQVVARSASGQKLQRTRVDITPDRGASLDLPAGTVLVTVTPARTTLSGAVLVAHRGAAVLPLTLPVLNGLVPAVRPGLP